MRWIFFLILALFLQNRSPFTPEHLFRAQTRESCAHTPSLPKRFFYLGEGAQVYAYLSEDGSTVLKLFKREHLHSLRPSRLWRTLSRTSVEQAYSKDRWKSKFQKTASCYELAFTHLHDETGLLYLHFNETSTPLRVELVDQTLHEIDLSKISFILQKKAELVPTYFKRLAKEGRMDKIEEAKDALKQLFFIRAQKGFTDPRQTLSINYGFIGDRPIQIDVGKIERVESDLRPELSKIYAHIEDFILNQKLAIK